MGRVGAYSESRIVPADRLIPLPDDIPDRAAAALMLKGLTVQYLFRQTFPLKGGETILFHAAAGGVGLIACQWAKALGVTMIGTAGSDEKAAAAKQAGAAHVIVYTRENFVDRVKEITGGKGVPVVYDAVGKDTFPASLDCLSPRGMFVSFGNASGPIAAFNLGILAQKGSLYDVRPTLATYTREARRPAGDGERAVRAGARGQDQGRRAPGVSARAGDRRASRAGVATDDGRDAADSVAREASETGDRWRAPRVRTRSRD